MFELLSKSDIEKMRIVGRIAAEILARLGEKVREGQNTRALDEAAARFMTRRGVRSSQLGYLGFPAHICTSRNQVVCHGIPNRDEVLRAGDIVNLDLTIEKHGVHADTSKTFTIGKVTDDIRRLLEGAEQSLEDAIAVVSARARVGDIGAAVSRTAADRDLRVVRDYCGHGIGRRMHMPPEIPHVGHPGRGLRLRQGMTFTIEPMLNLGSDACRRLTDGWTVETADGSYSAQFEHTVLVTRDGCEVLTRL